MKRNCLLFGLCILICGCAPHYKMQTPFVESEYQQYQQKGESTVKGQVFLRTVGGQVRYGAGIPVFLFPKTAYTTELANASLKIGPEGSIDNARTELIRVNRQTTADGEGHFEIKDIPNGDYYIFAKLVWGVWNGYGMVPTGGWIVSPVSVTKADTYNVVVTR